MVPGGSSGQKIILGHMDSVKVLAGTVVVVRQYTVLIEGQDGVHLHPFTGISPQSIIMRVVS